MPSKDYSWIFFVGFMLLGIAAIVIGATRALPMSVTMGAATVVVGVVTWITGATASPSGLDGGGAGIVITRIRWYVWLGCVALYGVAFAIGMAIGK